MEKVFLIIQIIKQDFYNPVFYNNFLIMFKKTLNLTGNIIHA